MLKYSLNNLKLILGGIYLIVKFYGGFYEKQIIICIADTALRI